MGEAPMPPWSNIKDQKSPGLRRGQERLQYAKAICRFIPRLKKPNRSPSAFAAFAADAKHVLAILPHCFAAFAADAGHVLAILADALAAFFADGGHVLAILADAFAAFFADGGHVFAVAAYGRPAFAGDLPLLLVIHGGKAA